MNTAALEVEQGKRFEFGKNWSRFLKVLDEERIAEAERSLAEMLEVTKLEGQSFLDVGSGSGLFSLAARRLGARVHSFDYDSQSVGCTQELKRRYFPNDSGWAVEQGSVLDSNYLRSLGTFDVVYSWGVLHHTGAMWQGLENVAPLVVNHGAIFISIYNDQGGTSRRWTSIKRFYNQSPRLVRFVLVAAFGAYFESRSAAGRLLCLQSPLPFKSWAERKKSRGMSVWHDLVDWVGGYPFEVAKPEQVVDFFHQRGFCLAKLKTCGGGLGCNEFVFHRRGIVR
jgi:2-polyprenyl-3-methyl-5-hydroxy-6-metoxy-1,4-benzoquinol methylase